MKGKILTYTSLYVTPEGYESPLRLCIVKTQEGNLLAYAPPQGRLKIGRRVNLERRGDHYYSEFRSRFGII